MLMGVKMREGANCKDTVGLGGKALPAECQTLIAFPHLMMLLVAVMMNYLTHISHIYDDAHILLQVRVILLALHNSFLCCRCASFLPNMFISRQICPILYPTKMSKLILLPHLTFKTHLSIKNPSYIQT